MAYKVFLSPSSQFNNVYAYGDTNEGTQCCRIADACKRALERCGFEVICDKTHSMEERVAESNRWGADLHLPIHTNAYNGKVTGTRIFTYAKPSASWDCALAIFNKLAPITPGTSENIKTYPGLYELRKANKLAVYCECDFHDVPEVARWIIDHVEDIGEAIAKGVCDYFKVSYVEPGAEKLYHVQVGAFKKKENAEKFLQQVQVDYPDAFIKYY